MEYTKDQLGNLELTFTSPINVDNGFTNEPQGDRESVMTLITDDEGVPSLIEWEVNEGELFQTIGLWFEGKTLLEYDGVFELPMEAIKLIRKAGYSVPREFEE